MELAQGPGEHGRRSAAKMTQLKRIRGAKAYAPFGAGRETGHQVPVVAAKLKSDRYRESRNTLCRGEKRRDGAARVK